MNPFSQRLQSLAEAGGAPPALQTLEITTPSASFVNDTRAAYDGRIGGTLQGQYVAIPGPTPRYFYFQHDDGAGNILGSDPGLVDPALSGFTGVPVVVPGGNRTANSVAILLETAATPHYAAVSRLGATVTIQGAMVAASAFVGGNWGTRGNAGLWGTQFSTPLANDFATTECIFQRLQALPAGADGNARLRGLKVHTGTIYVQNLRFAVYQGGASDTDPTGAVLVHDFGQLAAPVSSWVTLWAPGDIEIDPALRIWVAVKGSATSRLRYVGTGSPTFWGNTVVQALRSLTATLGTDPTVAYPDPLPAGQVAGTNFMFQAALVYETPPFVGDGSWLRRFGVHIQSNVATLNSIGFDGNVFMGGSLSPNVLDMQLDYLAIATQDNASFRLGLFGGGVGRGNPAGATLIADLGRAPAGAAGRRWSELAGGGQPVPPATLLWWGARDNMSGPTILFDPLAANLVNPGNDPFDWPANPDDGEYELTAASPHMVTDPNAPFEAAIATDASDITPGNQPASAVGLRVPGFVLNVP